MYKNKPSQKHLFHFENEIAVQEHLAWFHNPALIIISNSNWIGDAVPCITYSMQKTPLRSPRQIFIFTIKKYRCRIKVPKN